LDPASTAFEPPDGNLFGPTRGGTVLAGIDLREPEPRRDSPSWPPDALSATRLLPAVGAQLPKANLFESSPGPDPPAPLTDDASRASSCERSVDSHEPNQASLDAERPSWTPTAAARSAGSRRIGSRRAGLVAPVLVVVVCLGLALESLGGKSAHHLLPPRRTTTGAPVVARATIPSVQPKPPVAAQPAPPAVPAAHRARPTAHPARRHPRRRRWHKRHRAVARASRRGSSGPTRIESSPAPSPAPVQPSPPAVSAPAPAPHGSASTPPPAAQEFNFEQ
jgi:hypothetical protein